MTEHHPTTVTVPLDLLKALHIHMTAQRYSKKQFTGQVLLEALTNIIVEYETQQRMNHQE